MSPEILTLIGSVLAAGLGGGTVTGLLTYFRDRKRDRGEQSIGAVGSLERLNDRLIAQVANLQAQLDEERRQRRELEDAVDRERRARHALEARIALLEKRSEPEGEAL